MVILKPNPSSQLQQRSLLIPLLRLITRPCAALTTIHDRYGDLVLTHFFKKKLLFVRKPEHIEEVFSYELKNIINRDFLYSALKPVFFDGLINSKYDTWAKQRRLMQPLFTREAVATWATLIIAEADSFIDDLIKNQNAEINISKEIKTLVQTIFIKILFDRPGDDQNAERLFNAIDAITRGLVPQLVTEIGGKGKLKRLFVFQNRRYTQATQECMTFVYQEIDRKNGQIGQDLISRLMKAQDKKTGYTMTKELLKDEAVNLFFASQDTTVNTLVWFFYLIGKHQTVHKKITEEIRNHKDDLLTQENLWELSYTKAALYETLRLYPPSTALIRQPLEDVVIGGQAISKGTTIILGMYATHRDEKLWERPNEFYPERFVNPEMETERHKYAFFPFGGGLHNCIGRHFAELEMMIIIATLLRAVTFSTDANVKEAVSVTLKPNRDVILSMMPVSA